MAQPSRPAQTRHRPVDQLSLGLVATDGKASLIAHLAERAGLEIKAARGLFAALEETVLASINKKGLGEFTLPGLLKVSAQKVPAKKRRFGKDPFTGEERWFDAKPASIRIRARALKKLKDAAQ